MPFDGGIRGTAIVVTLALGLLVGVGVTQSWAELASIAGADGVIRIVKMSSVQQFGGSDSCAYQPSEQPGLGGRRFTYAKLSSLIRGTAGQYGLDPELVMALVKVESNFNPYAISPKGARGLMQLIPATARLYGLRNYYDPAGNVDAGVRHLRMLLEKYNHELDLALAAYNAGCGAVDRYGAIPPYGETVRFVKRVKAIYCMYRGGATVDGSMVAYSGGGNLCRFVREDGTIVIRAHSGRQ
ncbi:MAG TPA: lytic transglycosylase domain-containing protein [bacterium]|nr:lytic transglycosylase domain-containing protein [bacterium]